ncbi:MAG: hypothetical protein AAGL90_09985 [Pseudomonadota bacterium]
MKRFRTIRIIRREEHVEAREPMILDYGDPITVKLTREIADRKRQRERSGLHPIGL